MIWKYGLGSAINFLVGWQVNCLRACTGGWGLSPAVFLIRRGSSCSRQDMQNQSWVSQRVFWWYLLPLVAWYGSRKASVLPWARYFLSNRLDAPGANWSNGGVKFQEGYQMGGLREQTLLCCIAIGGAGGHAKERSAWIMPVVRE